MADDLACPVCGTIQEEAPWANGQGSLEICSGCGVQFGYTDMAGGDEQRRCELWRVWRHAWTENQQHPLSKEQKRALLAVFFGGSQAEP